MNQTEYFGINSFENVTNILNEIKASKLLIVTGNKSFELSGANNKLNYVLQRFETKIFSKFSSNPKVEDLMHGLKIFSDYQPDSLLAIGGGTAIDIAKMINFFGANNLQPHKWLKNSNKSKISKRPLVAVPTTSGSGSQATHFAVLYVDKKKHSIAHESLLPDYAIVDPQLSLSVPKHVAASSGIDALSQAIESYWSINSNEISKAYSKEAIKLIYSNIVAAVNDNLMAANIAVSKASHLAGKAINITKTTAAHSISYPITAHFGINHGHAVGLTLPALIEYNFQVKENDLLDHRGVDYVKKTIHEIISLLGVDNITNAKEQVENLIQKLGLEISLERLGINKPANLEIIIKEGFNPDRVKNNPRRLTESALRRILLNSL